MLLIFYWFYFTVHFWIWFFQTYIGEFCRYFVSCQRLGKELCAFSFKNKFQKLTSDVDLFHWFVTFLWCNYGSYRFLLFSWRFLIKLCCTKLNVTHKGKKYYIYGHQRIFFATLRNCAQQQWLVQGRQIFMRRSANRSFCLISIISSETSVIYILVKLLQQ